MIYYCKSVFGFHQNTELYKSCNKTVDQRLYRDVCQLLRKSLVLKCSEDTDDDGLIYATAIKWDFIQGTLKIVNIV